MAINLVKRAGARVWLSTLFFAAIQSGLRAQTLDWRPAEFAPRHSAAIAYDAAGGNMVVFGGRSGNYTMADTWLWNGDRWTLRHLFGPPEQAYSVGPAMVYDSWRDVVVLFLSRYDSPSGETWEWDGIEWTPRLVPAPRERYGHAMAFDAARGVTILFGGYHSNGRLADTWEWNGFVWTQRATTGPSARSSAGMAYDAARAVTVLFGGATGPSIEGGETWIWDGSVWEKQAVTGPAPRSGPSMTYDAARGHIVLFGGRTSSETADDTWIWDGAAWIQIETQGPPRRYSGAMGFDSARNVVVLAGGSSSTYGDYGDTWEWDGTTWQQRLLQPPPRWNTSMAHDSARGVTVLFGGTGAQGALNDTWEWNGQAWTQRVESGSESSPMGGRPLVYDSARRVCVLFGGDTSDQTWEWDGVAWMQRPVTGPSPRVAFAMSYDSRRSVVVLFGGKHYFPDGSVEYYGDTWEWDGVSWSERLVPGPPPQAHAHMAYDPILGASVFLGNNSRTETWEWDGVDWIRRAIAGPRPGYPLVFNAQRGLLVAYEIFHYPQPYWEYEGREWIERLPQGIWRPALRDNSYGVTFDATRGETILFGGRWGSIRGDTWLHGEPPCYEPSFDPQPVGRSTCVGGDVTLSFGSFATEPAVYQWERDGVSLTDEPGHIEGVATSTLQIIGARPDDNGVYRCRVANDCGRATTVGVRVGVCDRYGDFDCNGVVGLPELTHLLASFGRTDAPTRDDGDLDGDGRVGLADLVLLLGDFARPCP